MATFDFTTRELRDKQALILDKADAMTEPNEETKAAIAEARSKEKGKCMTV